MATWPVMFRASYIPRRLPCKWAEGVPVHLVRKSPPLLKSHDRTDQPVLIFNSSVGSGQLVRSWRNASRLTRRFWQPRAPACISATKALSFIMQWRCSVSIYIRLVMLQVGSNAINGLGKYPYAERSIITAGVMKASIDRPDEVCLPTCSQSRNLKCSSRDAARIP